jgi:hypothetical protein
MAGQTTLLPLNIERSKFAEVAMPTLGDTYITPNGRTGLVVEIVVKMTKGGYGTLNIAFDTLDPETGDIDRQWACVSPMA